jgi:hypothetical protein
MATGFNPSDVAGGYAVSGTGNTVVTTSASGAIRSATSHASGKWYAEITISGVSDASIDVGFASGSWTLGRPGFGAPSNSVGITPMSGSESIWKDNSSVAFNTPPGPMALNGTIAVAADVDNGLYYFITPQYVVAYGVNGWNGLTTGNPSTGSGGIPYTLSGGAFLAVGNIGSPGVVVTLNTGQSAFVRGIPAGFSAWDNWATAQAGAGLFFGAGVLTPSPIARLLASAAIAGAGGLAQQPMALMRGSATLPAVSQLFATQAQATMSAALATTSSNSASVALNAQQASFTLAGSVTSTDQAIGFLLVPSALAATTWLQNKLLDALFRGQSLAAPSTWYVALVTTLGSPIANGVECSGLGYTRSLVASSLVAWSGTQAPGTTTISAGVSDLISNNVPIVFPSPTGDWGTIVGYEIWDAPTGGNRWLSGKLSSAMAIHNADPARRFAAGSLTISLG